MTDFVPGLELCRRFYWEAVRPTLDTEFPGLRHAAALIGSGSEVLGFDTLQSSDHHWGPRAMLFLGEEDYAREATRLFEVFRWRLPHHFLGYPTNFAQPVPEDPGTRLLKATETGPIDHRVEVYTPRGYVLDYLGFDLDAELTPADWLSIPQQKLRTLTGGEVYHDEVGLEQVRSRFAYYPTDVWLYMLAAGWARIAQEEHLMGRAGQTGDEIGSSIIAARLARDAMNLCLLMEREYAPYAKWFGTAFMRLEAGPPLAAQLHRVLRSTTWEERGEALAEVYQFLAQRHNALALIPPIDPRTSPFWGRPFPVIHGDRFASALLAHVRDPRLLGIARGAPAGNMDQISDNTNVLENTPRRVVLSLFLSEDD